MSRYSSSRLLTPPKEEEEVYPYRPVWRSIVIEVSLLLTITMVIFAGRSIFGVTIPSRLQSVLNVGLALVPVLMWLLFSLSRERTVPEPRRQLVSVLIISALVASAISLPVIGFFDTDSWLSHLETIDRLIGFTVTTGIVHELTKYLVIRYMVPSEYFRVRLDTVAYGAASAVGYVTAMNLQLVAGGNFEISTLQLNIFANTVMQISGGMILAFGMAETAFSRRALLAMPASLLAAAVIHGLGKTAVSAVSNAGFTLGIAATRPLFSIVAAALIIYITLFIIIFLFTSRERQELQAVASREV